MTPQSVSFPSLALHLRKGTQLNPIVIDEDIKHGIVPRLSTKRKRTHTFVDDQEDGNGNASISSTRKNHMKNTDTTDSSKRNDNKAVLMSSSVSQQSRLLRAINIDVRFCTFDALADTEITIKMKPNEIYPLHPLLALSQTCKQMKDEFDKRYLGYIRSGCHLIEHERFGMFNPERTTFKLCWTGERLDQYFPQKQIYQRVYPPNLARKYLSELTIWQFGMDITNGYHYDDLNIYVPELSSYTLMENQHMLEGVWDLHVVDMEMYGKQEEYVIQNCMRARHQHVWARDLESYVHRQEFEIVHPIACNELRVLLDGRYKERCKPSVMKADGGDA